MNISTIAANLAKNTATTITSTTITNTIPTPIIPKHNSTSTNNRDTNNRGSYNEIHHRGGRGGRNNTDIDTNYHEYNRSNEFNRSLGHNDQKKGRLGNNSNRQSINRKRSRSRSSERHINQYDDFNNEVDNNNIIRTINDTNTNPNLLASPITPLTSIVPAGENTCYLDFMNLILLIVEFTIYLMLY